MTNYNKKSARRNFLAFAAIVGWFGCDGARAQTSPASLLVTRITITSAWAGECGTGGILNTSQYTRRNNFNSFYASGVGTWTVTLQYSDTACTGPWTSFGDQAVVTQASSPAIGYGIGYHPYMRFVFAGANATTVTVSYSAAKDFFFPTPFGVTAACAAGQHYEGTSVLYGITIAGSCVANH